MLVLSGPTWGALRYCWHAFYSYTSRPTWQSELRRLQKQSLLLNVFETPQSPIQHMWFNHPCYLSSLWGLQMCGAICWYSLGLTLLPSAGVCHCIPGCVNGASPWRKTWCNGSSNFSGHGVPSHDHSGLKLSYNIIGIQTVYSDTFSMQFSFGPYMLPWCLWYST